VALTVLDAGLLIAILDANDAHHAAARRALAAAVDRGDRLVVPASAYAELLVGSLREGVDRDDVVDNFLDALPAAIAPADRAVARRAAELRARNGNRLRLPDALVVATALVLGAARLMTTDARWPEVGVTVDVITDLDRA